MTPAPGAATRTAPRAAPRTAPTRPRTRRRTRLLVALATVAVLALLVVAAFRDEASTSLPLDPRNPDRDGAEAVARVLDREGVPVEVVRGQDALVATDVAGAVVVVTNPRDLGRDTAARLLRHARGSQALVAVGSGTALALGLLDDDLADLEPRGRGEVEAGCTDPLAEGLVLDLRAGEDLRTGTGGSDEVACFGSPGALVRDDSLGPPVTWLLSAPEVVANGTVTDADHAALALRLLGQGERVVWYVADPGDVAPVQAVGLLPLLPRWLFPALWLVALATLALVLWRGRRLGPLVVEPIPVVVRAAESTLARGRLYHRAADRTHAAGVLREATRARLARRLRLAPEASCAAVAEAVARRTGRDPVEVLALLSPDRPPTRDPELADLGRRLSALEDEVQTS